MYKMSHKLLLLTLSILLLLLVQSILNRGFFYIGDVLQYPELYRDYTWHHYSLSGWNFSKAPYFFPEIALYFVINALTNQFAIALFVLQLIELACVIGLFIAISRVIYQKHYRLTITPIFLFSALVLAVVFHDYNLVSAFTRPFYHFGAALIVLACLYFTLRYYQRSHWTVNSLVAVLCLLTVISDELFLPMFTVPIVITTLLCRFQGQQFDKGLFGSIICSSIFGFIITAFLPYHQPAKFSVADWSIFTKTVSHTFHGFNAVFMIVWVVSVILMLWLAFGYLFNKPGFGQKHLPSTVAQQPLRALVYFSLIMPVILLASVIAFNTFANENCFRYLILALILPPYIMVSHAAVMLHQFREKTIFIIMLILTLCLVTSLLVSKPKIMLTAKWIHRYPDEVNCIDRFSDQYPTRNGLIADGVNAANRIIIFYTKKHLWINAYTPGRGQITRRTGNTAWFTHDQDHHNQLPKYSFIIKSPRNPYNENMLGKPNKVISCAKSGYHSNYDILIFNTPQSISKLNRRFIEINQHFFKGKA